ncbi:MAG TPA: nucleotidyltransferase [Bacteroidales bacterium]|jgi:hypothetical protein|nr:nucleotidyltransferase [Bacteroidales bacterium]HPM92717.1 nucleotidyltransferase [Bacteroidales bacterium]
MLNEEIKIQLNEIFEEISNNLDITESQFKKAVESYTAVGNWLSDDESSLSPYKPMIKPQGSFLLGTMIRPLLETDELDVDLVCQLVGKNPTWTQFDLKNAVGRRLKANQTYNQMLDKEGRRCWTLNYADSSKFHMDILPSLISNDYQIILEKAYSVRDYKDYDKIAIRITDKLEENYYSETNPDFWNKSNPFGYAAWFQQKCLTNIEEARFLSDSMSPMPNYQKRKYPLQQVVQILKRHRDIMFKGDEDKPISIIITTLAAKAYRQEQDLYVALFNVVNSMEKYIEVKYSHEHNKWIKWIGNPVNEEENFADKWPDNPDKERNFFKWLQQIKMVINNSSEIRGIPNIQLALKEALGQEAVNKAFTSIAENAIKTRESGELFMKGGTGYIGLKDADNDIKVKQHNFHGEK